MNFELEHNTMIHTGSTLLSTVSTLIRLLVLMTLPLSAQTMLKPSGGHSLTPGKLTGHPRLWIRAEDVPRLRSWASNSNPLYRDGLTLLAARAKSDMDAGHLPGGDNGIGDWEQYPNEMYAELFAFMSLVDNDSVSRIDYAERARSLLMYVIDRAEPRLEFPSAIRTSARTTGRAGGVRVTH